MIGGVEKLCTREEALRLLLILDTWGGTNGG